MQCSPLSVALLRNYGLKKYKGKAWEYTTIDILGSVQADFLLFVVHGNSFWSAASKSLGFLFSQMMSGIVKEISSLGLLCCFSYIYFLLFSLFLLLHSLLFFCKPISTVFAQYIIFNNMVRIWMKTQEHVANFCATRGDTSHFSIRFCSKLIVRVHHFLAMQNVKRNRINVSTWFSINRMILVK